jgi:vitamin B12 transport system substrate-binding protein
MNFQQFFLSFLRRAAGVRTLVVLFFFACLNGEGFASSKPSRVVSLAPSLTETVAALGARSELVGVTQQCDYPAEAKALPKVGSYSTLNREALVALRPSLVLATQGNSLTDIDFLKSRGIKVEIVSIEKLADVPRSFQQLGQLLGKETQATLLQERWNSKKLEASKFQTKGRTFFLALQWNPVYTVAPQTWMSELFEAAGFKNIFREQTSAFPQVNLEFLARNPPRYLFYSAMAGAPPNNPLFERWHFKKTDTQKNFEAKDEAVISPPAPFLKNQKKTPEILSLPADVFERPGPRLLQAWDHLMVIARAERE